MATLPIDDTTGMPILDITRINNYKTTLLGLLIDKETNTKATRTINLYDLMQLTDTIEHMNRTVWSSVGYKLTTFLLDGHRVDNFYTGYSQNSTLIINYISPTQILRSVITPTILSTGLDYSKLNIDLMDVT